MVHSLLAPKLLGEGMSALLINLIALIGTIASWAVIEDIARFSVIGLDIVIAVLSIKWLSMRKSQTELELLKLKQKEENEDPDETD